jgi:hypothetical protein
VRRFEAELLEEFRSRHRDLLDHIRNEGSLPDEDAVTAAINDFKERFAPSEDTSDKREGEEDLEERTERGAEAEAARSEEAQ